MGLFGSSKKAKLSYEQRLYRLFMKYNHPEHVPQIEKILSKVKGREEAGIAAFVKKYGPEPPPDDHSIPTPTPEEVRSAAKAPSEPKPLVAPPAAQPSADTAGSSATSNATWKDRFQRMFETYDPKQLKKLDDFVALGVGKEQSMMDALIKRYGPEPLDGSTSAPPAITTPPPISSSTSITESHELSWPQRIEAMFRAYDPTQLTKLPDSIKLSAGQEASLMKSLVQRYGPEPVVSAPAKNEVGDSSVTVTPAALQPSVQPTTLSDNVVALLHTSVDNASPAAAVPASQPSVVHVAGRETLSANTDTSSVGSSAPPPPPGESEQPSVRGLSEASSGHPSFSLYHSDVLPSSTAQETVEAYHAPAIRALNAPVIPAGQNHRLTFGSPPSSAAAPVTRQLVNDDNFFAAQEQQQRAAQQERVHHEHNVGSSLFASGSWVPHSGGLWHHQPTGASLPLQFPSVESSVSLDLRHEILYLRHRLQSQDDALKRKDAEIDKLLQTISHLSQSLGRPTGSEASPHRTKLHYTARSSVSVVEPSRPSECTQRYYTRRVYRTPELLACSADATLLPAIGSNSALRRSRDRSVSFVEELVRDAAAMDVADAAKSSSPSPVKTSNPLAGIHRSGTLLLEPDEYSVTPQQRRTQVRYISPTSSTSKKLDDMRQSWTPYGDRAPGDDILFW